MARITVPLVEKALVDLRAELMVTPTPETHGTSPLDDLGDRDAALQDLKRIIASPPLVVRLAQLIREASR